MGNGTALPDVAMLPALAAALETTVDALLGYTAQRLSKYEAAYEQNGFYWGLNPNHLCYEIMKLRPPVRPYRVLDVGCGEGKDAVFLRATVTRSRHSTLPGPAWKKPGSWRRESVCR